MHSDASKFPWTKYITVSSPFSHYVMLHLTDNSLHFNKRDWGMCRNRGLGNMQKSCRNGTEQSKIKTTSTTQKHTFQITGMGQHKTDLFRTCGQHAHGKNLSKNLFEGKKEREKPNKKHISENASMQVKYRIQWQSAASVHSSWTLL